MMKADLSTTSSIEAASAALAAMQPQTNDDESTFPLDDLPEGVQAHAMAAVLDDSMREARLDRLAGALLADKKMLARVQNAIADRLRYPTDEQRDAHHDREFGYAQSRVRFEHIKRFEGLRFRDEFRALLRDHRHVEISFLLEAFPPPTDVFLRPLPAWPRRPRYRDLSFLRLVPALRRAVDLKPNEIKYRSITAEQRGIVTDELAQARGLASLRWNASCPNASKYGVFDALDALAGRDGAERPSRIELAIAHNYFGEMAGYGSLTDDDVKRLLHNDALTRLRLSASHTQTLDGPRIDIGDWTLHPSLTELEFAGCMVVGGPKSTSGASATTPPSKLERLTLDSCLMMGSIDDYENAVRHIARCSKLDALSMRHCSFEDFTPASTPNALIALRSIGALRRLTLSGMNIRDDDIDHVLAHEQLRELSLANNKLTSHAASSIARHPHLEALDLSFNGIKASDASALAGNPRLHVSGLT